MPVVRRLTFLAVLTLLATSAYAQSAPASDSGGRRLLAVFAHPDDETMAGALLAHYGAAKDVTVHLVIASNGERGVMPHAKIPAGDELAAVRIKEAACAAKALGAQPPVLLGFADGGLNQSQTLAQFAARLEQVIRDLNPQTIVTWGPEGGYGHPDHRLVSAVVTQIVQTGAVTPNLLYASLPASGLKPEMLAALKFPSPFRPTADEFLNVRVPYTTTDARQAREALGCHASQFTPQTMDMITGLTQQINGGVAYLRGWNGGAASRDVFGR
jgi:LmbE family N-acetylglucosaminyl deacetylase